MLTVAEGWPRGRRQIPRGGRAPAPAPARARDRRRFEAQLPSEADRQQFILRGNQAAAETFGSAEERFILAEVGKWNTPADKQVGIPLGSMQLSLELEPCDLTSQG